ncbi:MAG TPA: aminomethyltransferase beta-barrel domain-containing protein, partial [Beijerinckiaceae bacterium]
KLATGEPLYVVRLDAAGARVVVGPRAALATGVIGVADLNWLGDAPLSDLGDGIEVAVRVRSTRAPQPALLRPMPGDGAEVELLSPEDGVSPGQACVIYADDGPRARVLGGGTIARALSPAAVAA